jgi:membrane-associated phospholipid phosphatase
MDPFVDRILVSAPANQRLQAGSNHPMATRSNSLKKFIRARFSAEDSSGLFLTLLLLMLIVATCMFGAIAEDVVNRDPLTIIDTRFSAWLHDHAFASLTRAMLVLTYMHSALGVTAMTVTAFAWLWIKRLRVWVLLMALSVFGGMLLNALLKQIFGRTRPHFENPLLTIANYSFPSGHTMMATVFYATLCLLFVTRVRSWLWRVIAVVVSALMILLVGFSRIYLGVHYLSDVLAAIAEGLAWLAFCVISVQELERWRNRRRQDL